MILQDHQIHQSCCQLSNTCKLDLKTNINM